MRGERRISRVPRFLLSPRVASQPLSGNEDEEDAESGVRENSDSQNHECSLGKKSADVGLSYAGKVERRVLAQSYQGEDRIQRI